MGSGLFYAAALGLEVDMYGEVFTVGPDEDLQAQVSAWSSRWPSLAGDSIDQESFRDAALSELGADRLLKPDELKDLLGWKPLRRSLAPLVTSAVGVRRRVLGMQVASTEPRPHAVVAPGGQRDKR